MKHSAALKVNVGDVLALGLNKDGILWEVVHINFPVFTVQEYGTTCKPVCHDYSRFSKPTNAQLNAYKKRKEKYYADRTS